LRLAAACDNILKSGQYDARKALLAAMTQKQDFLVSDLKRLILSINGGRATRRVDASRLYRCEIPFEANPKIGFKESYCQFNARLKKWAKEMCFVIVASHWMIRVHGLGDLKIAFYQNVLPSSEDEKPCSVCGRFHAL
jgi:hypothetical protein